MSSEWLPLAGALWGFVIAGGIAELRERSTERRREQRDDAAWNREKRAQLLERGVTACSSFTPAGLPGYLPWMTELTEVNTLLNIYCDSETTKAFAGLRNALEQSANAWNAIVIVDGEERAA